MDITRRKAVYKEGKVSSSFIEKNELPFGWKLPIKKEGIVVTTLDFERFSKRPKLARMFMAAVDGLSSKRAKETLEQYVVELAYFWAFLDDMELAGIQLYEPRKIDSDVVKNYIVWLNGHTEWAISFQYYCYMAIKTFLGWLKRHHKKDLAAKINFPRNPFPRKNAQTVHRPAYSLYVTEQIKKAALSGIEEIKKRIETPYVKTGKGVDPRPNTGLWKDFDNLVWYFEHVLDCQYKTQVWLEANGHSSFGNSAYMYHKGLGNVWEALGVWDGTPYVKTGKGVDPRPNTGLWKDFDNMVWYFENILDCQYRTGQWLAANEHSTFVSSAYKYHMGTDNVWEAMGVWYGTTWEMLIPFLLLFVYLSGANPTPVMRMRRDCIRQHPTLDRRYLVLEKIRSGNASYKIKHSPLCITIVERVLEITKDLALEADGDGNNYLWLYRGRDGKVKHLGMVKKPRSNLASALNLYVEKHDIRDEDGAPVKLNLARLRPTFATRMFLKTKGDIVKLKMLLNHEWISTTMPYVSSAGMENMRENAANDLSNHENKVRAQVAVGNVASELGISKEETVRILSGDYDTYLGKCRNLLDSPLQGEKKGRPCTRFNNCLKCPSCVITSDDLHRLFSYYDHINRLQKFMPSDLFGKTYGWVIRAIDEVSVKFKPDTVEESRAKALSDPFSAWDTKLELAESLEKAQQGNDNKQDGSDTGMVKEAA